MIGFDPHICRAKRKDTGKWVYGYYVKHDTIEVCMGTDDPALKHYIVYDGFCDWGFEPPLQMVEVDLDTVGRYTGLREFVMADPSVGAPLFKGDIVEIWGDRKIAGEGYNSQYDGNCKLRGVITFMRGAWRVDLENPYNNRLFAAKGKEQYDRDLISNIGLDRFHFQFSKDLNECRKRNKGYKWGDIVLLGNVFDNPKLMEANHD